MVLVVALLNFLGEMGEEVVDKFSEDIIENENIFGPVDGLDDFVVDIGGLLAEVPSDLEEGLEEVSDDGVADKVQLCEDIEERSYNGLLVVWFFAVLGQLQVLEDELYDSGGGGGSINKLYVIFLGDTYLEEFYLLQHIVLYCFFPVLSALKGLQDQYIQVGSKVLKQFLPLGGQMPLDRYLLIVDCFFLVGQDKFMVAGHYPFLQGYVLTLVDGQILAFI